jgi:predicted aspartyl protease
LSLHAISGRPLQKSIQLRALVQNQTLIILVDSGSSHTFLNSVVAQKLEVEATPIAPLSVRVVNGNILSCNYEVKDFSCWIQGHTLQMDVKIIDMGAYDLVLGMD